MRSLAVTFILGSTSEQRFVFDNEQLAHEVEIRPFCNLAVPQ